MTREEAVEQLESLLQLLNEIMDMPIGWGQVKPPVHPDDVAALGMAIAALREQESLAEKQATSDWISVEERLPEDGVQVLACTKHGKAFSAHCEKGRWRVSGSVKVTHWMPLPEPPKEDADA